MSVNYDKEQLSIKQCGAHSCSKVLYLSHDGKGCVSGSKVGNMIFSQSCSNMAACRMSDKTGSPPASTAC